MAVCTRHGANDSILHCSFRPPSHFSMYLWPSETRSAGGLSAASPSMRTSKFGQGCRVGLEDNLWLGKGQLASNRREQLARDARTAMAATCRSQPARDPPPAGVRPSATWRQARRAWRSHDPTCQRLCGP
ncbi:hypothetical protein DPM13_09290 [Paracoccus mutanolyticus]|uniref:Uncharacterized protein n=1 Tax=Paracoccus mutanolyticus TaxID=1499308 RepID=A0ABN5M9D7_9RHOB|nr:hypothetical protein DPM13_09290 [Paracoccus mutanolyticus]